MYSKVIAMYSKVIINIAKQYSKFVIKHGNKSNNV